MLFCCSTVKSPSELGKCIALMTLNPPPHTWTQKYHLCNVFFFSGYGDRYFTTSCNYFLLALFSISNMFHFYAWKWFSFKKKSCWHVPRYQYPQTIVSFHKSSKTRQQLREDVYKVIFVILLKKMFEDHEKDSNRRNLRNSALNLTMLYISSWNLTFDFSS